MNLPVGKYGVKIIADEELFGPLLQVMPWPVYGNMIDQDLNAIYEFLSAIPSRPDNPNPGP